MKPKDRRMFLELGRETALLLVQYVEAAANGDEDVLDDLGNVLRLLVSINVRFGVPAPDWDELKRARENKDFRCYLKLAAEQVAAWFDVEIREGER